MEESKKGKKVGYFFLTLVPIMSFFAVQVLASIVLSVVGTVKYIAKGGDITDTNAMLSDILNSQSMGFMTVVIYVISFIVAVIIYIAVFKIKKPENPGKVMGLKSFGGIIIGMCGVELIMSVLMIYASEVVPEVMEKYAELIEQAGLSEMTLVSSLSALVLAPVVEEMIFRGMTMKLAGKFTKNFWVANVFQALLFGIAHMNIVQGTYAFLMGLLLGLLYRKFDSLYATMLAHLTFNFMGTFGVMLIFGEEETVPAGKSILLLAIGIIIAIAGIYFAIKCRKFPERENNFMARVHGEVNEQNNQEIANIAG